MEYQSFTCTVVVHVFLGECDVIRCSRRSYFVYNNFSLYCRAGKPAVGLHLDVVKNGSVLQVRGRGLK